jgi:Zn-dependent peptidase ImmA (M78 family)
VRRYHERFQGSPELPVPVEAIAEDLLGLSVGELEELEVSGMLLPEDRQVWLNAREARESPGRRRFTLAHEVGHWVCQVLEGRVGPVFCRAEEVGVGEGRALEREANVFAAELLMPEEVVTAEFDGTVQGTAARFGVSEEAIGWRLYYVGCLDAKPRHLRDSM